MLWLPAKHWQHPAHPCQEEPQPTDWAIPPCKHQCSWQTGSLISRCYYVKEESCRGQPNAVPSPFSKERLKDKLRSPQWSSAWHFPFFSQQTQTVLCLAAYRILQWVTAEMDIAHSCVMPSRLLNALFSNLDTIALFICTLTFNLFCEQLTLTDKAHFPSAVTNLFSFIQCLECIEVKRLKLTMCKGTVKFNWWTIFIKKHLENL